MNDSGVAPQPGKVPYVSRGEAGAILRGAAATIHDRLEASFGQLAKAVYDDLSARWAFEAAPMAVRQLINDRLLELRRQFLARLVARQDEIIDAGLAPHDYGSTPLYEEDLSLLESASATTATAAYRAGGRLRGKLDDLIRPLQAVTRYLLGRTNLPVPADPFAPDVATYALVESAAELGLPTTAWDELLRDFEEGLAAQLREAYQAVSDYFLGRGLDPRAIRRDLAARLAAQRSAEGGSEAAAAETPAAAAALATFGGAARFDAPTADPTFVLSSLLARLEANARDLPIPALPRNTPPAPKLLNAVSELQKQGLQDLQLGAPAGAEGQWREQLVDSAGRTVEKLTIELVGLLFEQVLRDPQVPAEIKALLSRMQFPILKAALLDADFFAANNHPARRLIDRIASTSLGWEPRGEENERYRAEVERIVKEVLTRFEKNVALFDKLADEFERFLDEQPTRDNESVRRAQRALEAAERHEVLVGGLSVHMLRMFEKVELEPYLREFLLGPWVQVLAAAIEREATEPGFASRFRAAIPDLVWSVQPKGGTEDRRRLMQTIPELVPLLREGLALIRASADEINGFFRQLMQSHTDALRPVDQATFIKAALVSSEVKARVEEIQTDGKMPTPAPGTLNVPATAVMDAAQSEQVDLALSAETGPAAELDRVGEAKINAEIAGWARGSWFELVDGDMVERAHLRFVSPLRSLFMFSTHRERDPLVFTLQAVKDRVAAGALRPIEQAPLTKRAVESLLAEFEHRPAKAQELAARYEPPPT